MYLAGRHLNLSRVAVIRFCAVSAGGGDVRFLPTSRLLIAAPAPRAFFSAKSKSRLALPEKYVY
jgi:hypothetical protein